MGTGPKKSKDLLYYGFRQRVSRRPSYFARLRTWYESHRKPLE